MSYTMRDGGSGSDNGHGRDNGISFGGVGNGGQLMDRRIDRIYKAINTLSLRITDLEVARDEKAEPYDVMDSFRATKPDAGEPTNRYFVDCLKENAKLIEENDVIKYQYEAMHKEAVRCKEQIDQLQKTIADKQKVLEDVMDQKDRYLKQIYALHVEKDDLEKSNEYLRGTLKNYEDMVAELDQENKNFKQTVIQQAASINNLYTKNKKLEKKIEESE